MNNNGAVYWVGQDGNIYYKAGQNNWNVQNMGRYQETAGTNYNNGFDSSAGSFVAQRINDPLSGGANTGNGGSGGNYVDTTAARNSTLGQISSLDTRLANLNQSSKDQLDQLLARYNSEDALAQGQYNDQVTTNEKTRSGNINDALVAAAEGGRGLRSNLSALNALNGTGLLLANRAIARVANNDVGGANETFDKNAKTLNNAWAATEQDQRNRKEEANTDYNNALKKNAATIASSRQNLFKDMASFFTQSGDNSSAANWLAKINGENPTIEAADAVKSPTFQARSAAFSPSALDNYLAGKQDMTVQAQPSSGAPALNSPLFATTRKRETPA